MSLIEYWLIVAVALVVLFAYVGSRLWAGFSN